MQFKYILAGGCGGTIVKLDLLDNQIFKIKFNDNWMEKEN